MTPKKALIVLSDSGFHWDELADAFHVFRDVHWQIDVASPLGRPKVEALSLRPRWLLHLLGRGTTRARLPKSEWWGRPVIEAVMRAKRLDAVDPRDYDGLFICGGLGDMPDIEGDLVLARILGIAVREGQPIAGRLRVLGSYQDILAAEESAKVYFTRWPRGARAAAWKVVEQVVRPEDLHGFEHVPEFLDRKAGKLGRRAG